MLICITKIHRKNMMTHVTGKAALLALSMISASAFASHWSYEGEGSPQHWGEMDEAYKTCQSGMNQSPVNIDSTTNAHLSPLQTHYVDGPVTLTNNGHTFRQVNRRTPAIPLLSISKPGRYSSSISTRRAKTPYMARGTRWKCIWFIKMPVGN